MFFIVAEKQGEICSVCEQWRARVSIIASRLRLTLYISGVSHRLRFGPFICSQAGTDVDGSRARRCDAFPQGVSVGSSSACLAACQGDAQCVAWVYADDDQMCYPLQVCVCAHVCVCLIYMRVFSLVFACFQTLWRITLCLIALPLPFSLRR